MAGTATAARPRLPAFFRARTAVLLAAAVGLSVAGLSSPMLLIFPMWIVTWLARPWIRAVLAPLPAGAGFFAATLAFGLLTETFAIATNLSRPPADRILLDPDPRIDLALAVAYYASVAATWTLLLRARRFTARDVFAVTGLYGIVVEQSGAVLVAIFSVPVFGATYAAFVACVYGLFPSLGLLVTDGSFDAARRPASPVDRAAAFALLFVQYVVCGLFALPAVRALVA